MLKSDLRWQMLAWRRAMSDLELATRSQQVAARLFKETYLTQLRAVHVFLPIQRQRELDTWGIIRRFWREFPQVRVVVPVMQEDGLSLRHYLLTPQTELVENAWDVPEPLNAEEVMPEELDAVLLPLLAFDEAGNRVGYGKGFYDRFLLQCRPDVLLIGLSLEDPVLRIADAWEGDVRLHCCVTPTRVWRFER
ncbi:5-formyltetrahydrofolate cyclo-ligase [Hymenobacter chitinivorans]|uniref:5-formyltetrahydrofolate cyclo-ligase n=1 Tax=Hymenobacter chitinivorans DSM 11115 TaxID=1121954 RepID=A0A2M9B585_9BACT|nr:5-formyltetrahydrofolate cyclo-ligase [Hymenobacter chitinivorans]PJJ53096.1 5-formyltetrahydrofolate cyclo-ligase [Hymenobacter chitinivorans DSM 11115]